MLDTQWTSTSFDWLGPLPLGRVNISPSRNEYVVRDQAQCLVSLSSRV